MIVIDASAAVLALLNEGGARERLARDDLHAPHLIDAEVAHALRAQVRRGAVRAESGGRALEGWRHLGLRRYPARGMLSRVWALRENLSAYDALYVALAEALRCPLLTADARLAAAPTIACEVTIVRS